VKKRKEVKLYCLHTRLSPSNYRLSHLCDVSVNCVTTRLILNLLHITFNPAAASDSYIYSIDAVKWLSGMMPEMGPMSMFRFLDRYPSRFFRLLFPNSVSAYRYIYTAVPAGVLALVAFVCATRWRFHCQERSDR
jgi:hypothetical protein